MILYAHFGYFMDSNISQMIQEFISIEYPLGFVVVCISECENYITKIANH